MKKVLKHIAFGCRQLRKLLSVVHGSFWGNLAFCWCGCRCGGVVRCFGIPRIENSPKGEIVVGSNVILRSSLCSNPAGCFHPVLLATRGKGVLCIGDGAGITSSAIVAENSVSIGRRVQIGANCAIYDTDFHALDPERRCDKISQKTAPVVLEDDVWLGANVLVLKGAVIGHGSVVGAGSVVTGNIPPMVIAAGNPARVVRSLEK